MGKCPKCGKGIGLFGSGGRQWDSQVYRSEWNGQMLHYSPCYLDAKFTGEAQVLKSLKLCENCHYYKYDSSSQTIDTGIFMPNYKVLTFTSHDCVKFGFSLKAEGKEAENCTSYITDENYQKKCLSGDMDKDKGRVQIVLDFSSLKDVMSKGGLVMSTYKCPNCNGMVDIPEAGKVLVCKYCSTPIKPVDIFERIKSLMQSGETVTENPKEIESKPEEQEDESKPDWYKEALKQHKE